MNINYSDHILEEKRNDAKFKSKYHIHELTYQKPIKYNSAGCDICRRSIFNIQHYHCSLCDFDVCPTCKLIEEEKGSGIISTPLYKHFLIYHENQKKVKCNLCKIEMEPYNSYRCDDCDFNICEHCLSAYKW